MMVMRYCDDDEVNGHLVPVFYEFLKKRSSKGEVKKMIPEEIKREKKPDFN